MCRIPFSLSSTLFFFSAPLLHDNHTVLAIFAFLPLFYSCTALGCELCPAGKASNVSFASTLSNCSACSPGSYSGSVGSTSCSLCPPGSMAASSGSTSCTLCPFNTYQSAAGSLSCIPCPGSSVTSSTGSTLAAQCIVPGCTPGTYCVGGVGITCPLGFYCPAGTPQPVACPIGTWGSSLGLSTSSCSGSCPAGQYGISINATSQASACSLCPLGTYVPYSGSSQCYACAPGSYTDVKGLPLCSLCGLGSYSNALGATSNASCISCPLGRFSQVVGSTIIGEFVNRNPFCVSIHPFSPFFHLWRFIPVIRLSAPFLPLSILVYCRMRILSSRNSIERLICLFPLRLYAM